MFRFFVSLTLVFALVVNTAAAGIEFAVSSLASELRLAMQGEPADYTETSAAVETGPSPSRDPATQNGIWNNDSILALGDLEQQQAAATLLPVTTAPYNAPTNIDPNEPIL